MEGPPFADSISEGTIVWSKQPGDAVAVDEVVGQIETDKTAMDVVAPKDGALKEHLVWGMAPSAYD